MPLTRLIGILYIVGGAIGLLSLLIVDPLGRSDVFNDPEVLLTIAGLFLLLIGVGCFMAIPNREAEDKPRI